MPNINSTMSSIAGHNSNIQASNADMDKQPPRRPYSDPVVIDLTKNSDDEDAQASNQTKEDNKFKSGTDGEDSTPAPTTAVKTATSPVKPLPSDLKSNGSDQRPAAQKGQADSSPPFSTPAVLSLPIATQNTTTPGVLANPQPLLASNPSATAVATSGNASRIKLGLNHSSLPKDFHQIQQDTNKKLKNAVQKNANLKKELEAARESAAESKKEAAELTAALSNTSQCIVDLQQKLKQAEITAQKALQQAAASDNRAAVAEQKLEAAVATNTRKLAVQTQSYNEIINKHKIILSTDQKKLETEKTANKEVLERALAAEQKLEAALAAKAQELADQARQNDDNLKKQLSDSESKLQAEISSKEEAQGRAAQAEVALQNAIAEAQNKDKMIVEMKEKLKKATAEVSKTLKTVEEHRMQLELADQRVAHANAAADDASKKAQEADEKLRCAQSKLLVEISTRKDAEKEAFKAKLAAKLAADEAEANAETAIVQKNEEVKKVKAEKERAEAQAAEREKGLKAQLAAAEAALQSAEESKKAADACYKKDLAEKNEEIKNLTARCQIADCTANKARDRDEQKARAVASEDREKNAKARIKKLEEENAALFNKLREQEGDMQAQANDIHHHEKEIMELTAELKAKNDTIKDMEYDYKKLKYDFREIQDKLEEEIFKKKEEHHYNYNNNKRGHRDRGRARSLERKRRREDNYNRHDDYDNKRNKRNNNNGDLREQLHHRRPRHRHDDFDSGRRGSSSKSPPASASPIRNYQEHVDHSQQRYAPFERPASDPRQQQKKQKEEEKKEEREEGECRR